MSREAFRALVRLHGKTRFRMPRAPEPVALKRMYATRLKTRVLEDAIALVREKLVPKLEALAERASRVATTDAMRTDADDVGDIVDEISDQYFEKWTRREFGKVVRTVGQDTAKFQAKSLNKQLGSALADGGTVDVVGSEPWLGPAIEEFTRENVALIRTLPEVFFSDLEKHIMREVADGARFDRLAEIIQERYDVAESRAELIARDQVSKFQGDLNRVRQRDLGIEKFVWRSMGDERVRDEHVDRNGQTYEWDKPPEGETPGEPVACRCYAEPDLTGLLEDTE